MSVISPCRDLDIVHRVGAAVLGVGLCVFGILGFVNRLPLFSGEGGEILGLSSNGLLALLSLVVGGTLIGAAWRGGRTASTVTAVIGALFLLSGLANLAVLDTAFNVLAFQMSNVIFSFVVGMLLLFLGAYGRFSGGLPVDNPYYRDRHPAEARDQLAQLISTQQDEDRWVAAEVAVAEGHATPEQEQLVFQDAQRRAAAARRRAWELYEQRQRAGQN